MKGNTPFEPLPEEIPDEITILPKGNLGALSEAETEFVEQGFEEVFSLITSEAETKAATPLSKEKK